MTNHQTLSFLTRRFAEVGIRPRIQHGQNFLIDLNLLRLLVERAELTPDDVVLEVGTGTGSLTAQMAPLVARVVTVEIDPRLYQLSGEELIDFENITRLQVDALRGKHQIAPEVLAAVGEALSASPGRRLKLVANLPYHVATPLMGNLLAGDPIPASMTVTIQKEVADRLLAEPGSRDYGAMSLWVRSQCDVELVRILPPSVFWPRPKVHSAIVHLRFRPELRARLGDAAFFHTCVRALFLHRRKVLRTGILSAYGQRLAKPEIDALLSELGLPGDIRAEQLDVERMIALASRLRIAVAE